MYCLCPSFSFTHLLKFGDPGLGTNDKLLTDDEQGYSVPIMSENVAFYSTVHMGSTLKHDYSQPLLSRPVALRLL